MPASVSTDNTSVYEITIEPTTDSKYSLFDAVHGKYLRHTSAAASTNNYLQLDNNLHNWTIALAADGLATMNSLDGGNDRNELRYNLSNNLFACYLSTNSITQYPKVYLYKAVEPQEEPYIAIVSPENGASVYPNVTITYFVANYDGQIDFLLEDTTTEVVEDGIVTQYPTFGFTNDLEPGEYTLTLTLSSLNTPISATVTFIVVPIGNNDILTRILNIYPNPAETYFKINSSENINNLTIINSLGQIVKEYKNVSDSDQINIEGLKTGLYVIKIQTNNGDKTLQLIIKE